MCRRVGSVEVGSADILMGSDVLAEELNDEASNEPRLVREAELDGVRVNTREGSDAIDPATFEITAARVFDEPLIVKTLAVDRRALDKILITVDPVAPDRKIDACDWAEIAIAELEAVMCSTGCFGLIWFEVIALDGDVPHVDT